MKKPNILFLFDDQHRYDYLGASGASWLNTPNLDRIAARGMRFTQATTIVRLVGLRGWRWRRGYSRFGRGC